MPFRFESDLEIPETCPAELMLPLDEHVIEHNVASPQGTMTPIEMSWLIFADQSTVNFLLPLKQSLELYLGIGAVEELHNRIRRRDFDSHINRLIARVALDPRRFERFDLAKSYLNDRGVGLANRDAQQQWLEDFHITYGVVHRTDVHRQLSE